jgi:flagellar protein FliL
MAAQQQPKSFQEPEPADAPEHIDPPPKKRGKLVLILCLVLVLAGGGAAGVYFMQPAHSDAGATVAKPPVFVPLDTFTVNLVSDPARMQFMQAAITLKLSEKATAELIKDRLPEVRDRVLIVLSAKSGSEILSVAGKQKLAVEIADAVKKVIVPARVASPSADVTAAAAEPSGETSTQPAKEPAAAQPPIEVLFTSFIVQ